MDIFHSLFATPHSLERIALAACFASLSFAGLVVLARSLNPIPSRTRPLNSSAPMVLWLKPWESRSLPGLPRTKTSSLRVTIQQNAVSFRRRRFLLSGFQLAADRACHCSDGAVKFFG